MSLSIDQDPVKTNRLKTILTSIKGQIFIIFTATFISLVGLTLLNSWSLSNVKASILRGERYYDLLNSILEVRRFEKNFFLYHDMESLRESAEYLETIDTLANELSRDIIRVTDGESYSGFIDNLRKYEKNMDLYARGMANGKENEEIRVAGKAMVDFSEHLLAKKKILIQKALARASFLPFAFMCIFILLTLLLVKLISQGLLKPLKALHNTIRRVTRGDFSPTPYMGLHTHEISRLIWAFNRMAHEIDTNQKDLLQAKKIAALGTFTAGIAHELNNPINNISLTAETFIENHSETMDEDARELMNDILSQAERAGDIVRNLLDFSRSENPVFSDLDAKQIVTSTASLVKNQVMLAGITFKWDIPDNLPMIRGNLRNLQQVFMNLFLNAVHSMNEGGILTVRIT
jgi:nitrogen fixation/metabolism regulation signal transduction histidine kinase